MRKSAFRWRSAVILVFFFSRVVVVMKLKIVLCLCVCPRWGKGDVFCGLGATETERSFVRGGYSYIYESKSVGFWRKLSPMPEDGYRV